MNKWEAIFLAILVLSVASCEGIREYGRAQVDIAKLQCTDYDGQTEK